MGLLTAEHEKVKQEKEGFEFKISKFDKSAKDLNEMLESQITDKSKKGVGLEEFKEPEVNKYGPRDSNLKPTTGCDKELDNSKENTDDSLEQHQMTDTETSSFESPLKVKPVWNNSKRVNDHYSTRITHPNPKRNFVPKAVLMKTGIRPVNAAKPKAAYNAVKRNRFNTVKASACWVWMPKNRVVAHMHRLRGGKSATKKKKNPEKSAAKKKKNPEKSGAKKKKNPEKSAAKAERPRR
ncbi:hypothetical protein Tco_1428770 [Tanacetum coccineum]